MRYRAVRVSLDGFDEAAQNFFADGGSGLNITVPFKGEAFDFAHQRSDRSERARAVNTLSRLPDGTIVGDNTDGIGLLRDMIANLGWQLNSQRVLILGAGGAVRGVLEPLLREHPKELLVVNCPAPC
jgi:shikimate dehydrogenase